MAHQYYPNPNSYPHSPAFIQPHPSNNDHVPIQHYGSSLARPSSSFMPPPSTLPEDVNRFRNLQPQNQRPNLWPRDLTEDQQRQLQDRYTLQNAQTSPINPYYAQQPTSTAAAIAPSASFTSPPGAQTGHFQRQHTESPANTFPSATTMTSASLPPASSAKQEAFTPAAQSEPTAQEPRKPTAPQPVNTQQAVSNQPTPAQNTAQQVPAQSPTAVPPSPLEAERVTALLDINRLLLYSIFAIQTPPKTTASDGSDGADPSKPAQPQRPSHLSNPHYTDYMRRLQSNLAYLACVADRPHKPQNPVPPFPAILETPAQRKPEPEAEGDGEREKEMRQKYEKLKNLWPDWKGDVKKG